MGECVFCRIIAGDIPAATLLETDKVISFLDINPVNPGHALVVPKRHVSSLLGLNQEELHVAIFVAKRVAGAVL
ncbi:MAG: HIT domain-containing protein, partial [Planctomycetota bacterium]